ncbi:MAG: LCP family protein [Ruminococcus sp.]|nr:LCP family protein [Ruminococcus sp.]
MSNKKKNKKSTVIITVIIVLLCVLAMISVFRILDAVLGSGDYKAEEEHISKTVTVDGVDYFPRQDITVLMLMGIDERGKVQPSTSYNNTGEADMVALAIFDEIDESYSVLVLNRDTMMDIRTLGIGGKPSGTVYGQLALAHTYGTGLEDSCENTVATVSDFLSGLTVDYYLSMNMDAISILNDAVGGVTVNVKDDFSAVDSTIPMGEVTLNGEQALSYVQTRKDVGNQMNISRMDRHKEYMDGFVSAFNAKVKESDTFVLETYDKVAEYIVSDCSVNSLSSMLNRYADYELREIVTPEGENKLTEEYFEFHVDEKELDKLIIKLFYTEKK